MKEILRIEKVNTLKSIFAILIDIALTVALGVVLFFGVTTPIFKSTTPLAASEEYKASQERIDDTDDKLGYDLTLKDDLGYKTYIIEAKQFFEYYETEITAKYAQLAAEDKEIEDEYKPRFSDIHFIYNHIFLGLDYKANPVDESSYANSYFIYQFDEDTKLPLWNEYGIDNPRTQELNPRGMAEREQYVYMQYTNLVQVLALINSEYTTAISNISLYMSLSSLTATLITYIIFYIIFPLILRNNATIGKKIFGYGYMNKKGTKVSWYKGPCKALCAMILPAVGMFFFTIYSLVIFVIGPIFINLMYYILAAKEQDILDRIFRIQIIDLKHSLFFASKEDEEEYLKNETSEEYTDEEKEYTDRLSNLGTLNLKSVEEKIEDEQRSSKKSK